MTEPHVFIDSSKIKVAVIGGGSFGTALAYVLSKNSHNVVILSRNPKVAESINTEHKNPSYLSDFVLPNNITGTSDPKAAFEGADFILHSVPCQASFEYLRELAPLIPSNVPIINSSKGLHTQRLEYMSELIPAALERVQPMAFVSGPSFAKELLSNQPTAIVVASTDQVIANKVQELFASAYVRVYTTDDVIGVEVGGALKNVFAIAAGITEGLGFGMNTMAALVTRSCSEITKLAVAMGAHPKTVSGLSGIGDLMLTCFGSLSRNRTVGKRLGQGEKIQDILASMKEVAEGVATTPAAVKLAEKYNLDLPIVKAVAQVLEGTLDPRVAVDTLFSFPLRPED